MKADGFWKKVAAEEKAEGGGESDGYVLAE